MKVKSEVEEILLKEAEMINKQEQYKGNFVACYFSEEKSLLFGNGNYVLEYTNSPGIRILKIVGGYHL